MLLTFPTCVMGDEVEPCNEKVQLTVGVQLTPLSMVQRPVADSGPPPVSIQTVSPAVNTKVSSVPVLAERSTVT